MVLVLVVIVFASAVCCSSGYICNGDYNASYTDCPFSCPSTCTIPNAQYCNRSCTTPVCECNSGYLLSSINGICIKPEDCPGGKVCRQNEIFASCIIDCPDLYCPVDEYRAACSQARPCLSGCACRHSYLRKSVNDHTCIPASDCPPGKCPRPNEEWNGCASPCFSDSCEDRNKVTAPENCPLSQSKCRPRCLCKKGFLRNELNACVPVKECPCNNQSDETNILKNT